MSKETIVKGVRKAVISMPLMFLGAGIIHNAFINKQHGFHYIVAIVGIGVCFWAVAMMYKGIQTILNGLFDEKPNNLNTFLGLIMLLPLCSSCYQQERDCKTYQYGTFVFEQEIEGKVEQSIFTRDSLLQVETFRGKIDSSSVRWINDCEFVLKKINPKRMADKKGIHMKILTTDEKGYHFEFNYVGESQKMKGYAKRMER